MKQGKAFCVKKAFGPNADDFAHTLGTTFRMMKRALSASIEVPMPHWQPGFFDHLLLNSESYSEKWGYVW